MMISLLISSPIVLMTMVMLVIVCLIFSRWRILEWTTTVTTTIEAAAAAVDDDATVPQMNRYTSTTKTTTTRTSDTSNTTSTITTSAAAATPGTGTVVGVSLAIIILQPHVYQELDLTLNKLLTEYKTQCHQALEGFSQMLERALAVEQRMGLSLQLNVNGMMDDEDQHQDGAGDGEDRHRRHRDWMKKKIQKFFSKSSRSTPTPPSSSSSSSSSMLLSSSIRRRIYRTIECLEHDEQVLKRLLSLTTTDIQGGTASSNDDNGDDENIAPAKEHTKNNRTSIIPRRNVRMALPNQDDDKYYDKGFSSSLNLMTGENFDEVTFPSTSPGTTMNGISKNQYILYNHNYIRDDDEDDDEKNRNEHSYESAIQILAHLVRDWTKDGRSARLSIYGWICTQILHYSSSRCDDDGDDDEDDNCDEDYLNKDCVDTATPLRRTLTVLVPGSGMGRLAYDISRLRRRRQEQKQKIKGQRRQIHRPPICYDYSVEANELSISMTVAASSIISNVLYRNNDRHHRQQHTEEEEEEEKVGKITDSSFTSNHESSLLSIHPYVMDNLANEIDVERRYDKVYFPDIVVRNSSSNDIDDDDNDKEEEDGRDSSCGDRDVRGSLSFTVGDFGSRYYTYERRGEYDFVVTAFFLDTAYNVYEYIETIKNLLRKRKGIWINVGPVQWHQKSVFRPSVDELRNVVEHVYHFKILHWAVDDHPISYRDGGEFSRYTNYEGYRPLRFVASVP